MLRRAASGHIAATQLSKFAAASRIALAVISGWPEAPSSPLHGGAGVPAPAAAPAPCARGTRPDGAVWLPWNRAGEDVVEEAQRPPPPDDLRGRLASTSSAARHDRRAGSALPIVPSVVVMSHPAYPEDIPLSGGLVTVSNQLNKAVFCGVNFAGAAKSATLPLMPARRRERTPSCDYRGILGHRGTTHPPLFPAANRLPTCDQLVASFSQGIPTLP